MTKAPKIQVEKFRQATRELETYDNVARLDKRTEKLVMQKPVPEKPE